MKTLERKQVSRKAPAPKQIVETDTTGDISYTRYSDGSEVATFTGETRTLIARQAKESGRTFKQYVQAAVDLGLAEMERQRKLPITFPARAVQLLEELLEASGTGLSAADYAELFLQEEITASLTPGEAGVPEMLAGSYQLEPGDMPAMHAVIDRWRLKVD